jgi:type II secretory pathway component PulK
VKKASVIEDRVVSLTVFYGPDVMPESALKQPEQRRGLRRKARVAGGARGIVLVVVLAIVVMLGLVGGTFLFYMNAKLALVQGAVGKQQSLLAAESGFDRLIYVLRSDRTDMDSWYNNPEMFRRIPVWLPGEERLAGDESSENKDYEEGMRAWRFSVISSKPNRDQGDAEIRYGVTDEAAKINLTTASRGQLLALFDQLDLETGDVTPEELTDALVDWQDSDDVQVSLNGAESSYYMTLEPSYHAKNRPLETVEELLMVKGFTGRIVYGEDHNRNGYPDENETDGEDGSFPPDNGDEILDRGIFPFVTVWSWDWNTANDNKPRIPLNAVQNTAVFDDPKFEYLLEELNEEVLQFIVDANKRGYKFRSVGELYELEVYENGVSNYTKAWREYDKQLKNANEDRLEKDEEEEVEGGDEDRPFDEDGGGDPDSDLPEDVEEAMGELEDGAGKDSKQNQAILGGAAGDEDTQGGGLEARPSDRDGDSGTGGLRRADGEAGEGEEEEIEMKGTPITSPATAQDMDILCDRFTTREAAIIPGLINVNTAPVEVLQTIPGLSEEQASSIVAARQDLSGEEKTTLGWLLSSGALDGETFALIAKDLTTRSLQFEADIVGFADHGGAYTRLQVIVEFRGEVPQILYYRDISNLGVGYPVRDDQGSETFAYQPQ